MRSVENELLCYTLNMSRGFNIGSMHITWYGIIVTCAILIAFMVGGYLCKRRGVADHVPFAVLLCVVPLAIFGARVWFVIFNPGTQLFDFSNGGFAGLAIHGGIMFGALGLFIYTRIKRVGFFTLCDIVVIVLILAHAIGRWGNFTNQEIYGLETSQQWFPFSIYISANGTWHLALFFYEFLLNIIGFTVLLYLFLKREVRGYKIRTGHISAFYFIYTGIVRIILEPLRTSDHQMTLGSAPVSILTSIALVMLGIAILLLLRYNKISQNTDNIIKKETPQDESKPTDG